MKLITFYPKQDDFNKIPYFCISFCISVEYQIVTLEMVFSSLVAFYKLLLTHIECVQLGCCVDYTMYVRFGTT